MLNALVTLPAMLQAGAEAERTLGRGGPDLTRYLLVCGGLVVAIGLLGWGLRRVLGGALRVRAARRSMHVVDVLPLGGKQRVAVVSCYDRTFVLGVGDQAVTLVAELDTEQVQAAEDLSASDAPAAGPRLGEREFEQLLRAIPHRKQAAKQSAVLGEGGGVLG